MNKSLSNEVYEFLLKRILSNELLPGELINRRNIAEEMGVSVAPVLEAMLNLEWEGFLESIPRKGTQIRILKEADIKGQLIVREAIECQAARMYCGKPVSRNQDKLLEMARKVDNSQKSTMEDWEIEIKFHRSLVELANCSMLTREFDRIMKMYLFYSMNRVIPNAEQIRRDNHIKLVNDLQTTDSDEGERIIRNHLLVGKEYFFKL